MAAPPPLSDEAAERILGILGPLAEDGSVVLVGGERLQANRKDPDRDGWRERPHRAVRVRSCLVRRGGDVVRVAIWHLAEASVKRFSEIARLAVSSDRGWS